MMNWRHKFLAAGIHFGLSIAIAGLAALLVFVIWYPYPYREISGGRELFFIVVLVDVVLGPLGTFVVFDRRKPKAELRRDLALVALLQLGGLGYGLWTVYIARPVHLVFEIDRFRVVHAIDVDTDSLSKKPAEVQAMPLLGPTLLGVRRFKNSAESMDATIAALRGVDIGARPEFWQSYLESKAEVLRVARPVGKLKERFPERTGEIDKVLQQVGRLADSTAYVPMSGRKSFWTAFIDPVTAEVVAFMPLDSF